jgi:hypothetical protein
MPAASSASAVIPPSKYFAPFAILITFPVPRITDQDWTAQCRTSSDAHVRYFLDTEYDGFGGRLISLALVPEDGGEELYVVIEGETADPWVKRHVLPYLDMVPEGMKAPAMSRAAAAEALGRWLAHDEQIEIIADWPEDLSQLAMLLVTGPGQMVAVGGLTLRLVPLTGFSTAANSAVPHNALHDARSLRDHVMNHLD